MDGLDDLFKGPLGHLLLGAVTIGSKVDNGLIYLQCQRNPQNYYSPDYCPAARKYYGTYALHYNYGKTPAQQDLHEVTIGGVKQLAGPADFWK